ALKHGWNRLLKTLRSEIEVIKNLGTAAIPQLDFQDIENVPVQFREDFKKTGVAVIRGVVSQEEALEYKSDVQDYIRVNPHTRAFPPHDPQVFELYWSPSQVRARAHPNVIEAQRFLMGFWHSDDPTALVSPSHPVSYADRLRIRHPGDTGFALGPHVDGGSVERWEDDGYGRGGVYDKIWQGDWEKYDPWEASCRLCAVTDLYQGAGACSMFRMFQGWLSMSTTGPNEGTLLVNPLLSRATAYFLLRPFFEPRKVSEGPHGGVQSAEFLAPESWELESDPNSSLQGASPARCQELNGSLHPHLDLSESMIHVPLVRPGDYVVWHCDTIHAVDKIHSGISDSSVMYIPACPLTEANAEYLSRQRAALWNGTPGPDFPGGKGESEHVGRATAEYLGQTADVKGQQAMGLASWDLNETNISDGQRRMLHKANGILGVRNQDEFDTMLLLSATNRTPLITLWTASWCSSCKVVAPGIRELIERDGIGENEGGVSFAEVEIDSPTIGDLAMRYMINSIPTLLSFSRQEAQVNTKVTSVDELKDTEFLRLWIQAEARRGGAGGAGGGLFGGLFGLVNR
ncbi:MAG: hypothetical protein M1830_001089, partial [Pleopsidium flavum]